MRYLNLDMKGSIAQFDTDASDKPSATRVHLEPGFSIPISTTWGSWITESRLLATYYHQDLDGVSDADLQEEVTRYVPEFRSHIGLVLERDTTLFPGYTETLEPQIQYLYVPEKDQSAIYQRYDTTLLQTDYYGLFRSRKYSSVDFIAPANQISYGATSRFLDENYKERLNISFGQILYLKSSYNQSNSEEPSNYSAWAVETDFNYDDRLFYHGGVQYDTATSSLQSANSALEYRFASGYLQTNYRYVDYDYIKNNFSNLVSDADTYASTLTEDGISQLGLLGEYKINRNWHAKGQYFYDLTTDNPLEWVGNLMYRSDCWYIGFSYSRQLVDWETAFTDPTYENNLSINLGIIGFGTNPPTSISDGDSSLGYGNPFLLNN
jgi:LPS-assembly protein